MKNTVLTQFTEVEVLQRIGATRLGLLLQRFSERLATASVAVPIVDDEEPETVVALAEWFGSRELPERIRETLAMIEAGAMEEDAAWLEEVWKRRMPCTAVPELRIDRALEVFLAAPEEFERLAVSGERGETTDTADCVLTDREGGVLTNAKLEPWPEPVNGAELLDKLVAIFKRYIVMPPWGPETTALFILHTYAYQLRDVSVYLGIESPEKQCGKTTLLTVINELANRAITAANISPPAFFRVIEDFAPTLLIDEADTFLRGNDQLRGILNAGYKRKTAYVLRAGPVNSYSSENGEEESAGQVTRFSCWCPKVMAGIGRLPETLADRCIVIRMQRKTAQEQCERLRDLEVEPLKRQCLRFVADNKQAIASSRPELPIKLSDRAADIWEPLLVLAELAGSGWAERAREAAVTLTAATAEQNPTASLLLDIFLVLTTEDANVMTSRRLVERLNGFSDRPWMMANRTMTERVLSQHLKPYGIRPKVVRVNGIAARGYVKEDFMQTFKRYIPKSEIEDLIAASRDAANINAANGEERMDREKGQL